MSLRRFLNVAYSILVEEYQRLGVDLISAIEKLSEWGEGAVKEPTQAVSSPAVASQNDQSVTALKAMKAQMRKR